LILFIQIYANFFVALSKSNVRSCFLSLALDPDATQAAADIADSLSIENDILAKCKKKNKLFL